MFKEDYVKLLEIISALDKKDDATVVIESKLKLIVERNNLDADYQKRIEDLNNRFRPLIEEVKEESK